MVEMNRTVPPAYAGVKNKTSSRVKCIDEKHADFLFTKAVQRLLDVNNWQHYSGKMSCNFYLTDSMGASLNQLAREGDIIRIDIPGIRTKTHKGYEWVIVEKVGYYENVNNEMIFLLKVKPAKNPAKHWGRTAFHFRSHANSTFIITRAKLEITCSVVGKNEKSEPSRKGFLEKIQTAFKTIVSWIFLSKLQWKLLTRGILSYSNKEKDRLK